MPVPMPEPMPEPVQVQQSTAGLATRQQRQTSYCYLQLVVTPLAPFALAAAQGASGISQSILYSILNHPTSTYVRTYSKYTTRARKAASQPASQQERNKADRQTGSGRTSNPAPHNTASASHPDLAKSHYGVRVATTHHPPLSPRQLAERLALPTD